MARFKRIVAPGVPHHVTQRGNRRQTTFFHDRDYESFLRTFGRSCADYDVGILVYCLMPNHFHGGLVPEYAKGLSKAVGGATESHSRMINARMGWSGHLWQSRYFSCAMDKEHFYNAARYILQNPVRAGLVRKAEDWPWSSLHAHLAGKCPLGIVDVAPLAEFFDVDWLRPLDARTIKDIRRHTQTGRPLGSDAFVRKLEAETGRVILPKRARIWTPSPATSRVLGLHSDDSES